MKLTRDMAVLIVVVLMIMTNGVLRSPVFSEREEEMKIQQVEATDWPLSELPPEALALTSLKQKQTIIEWKRKADLWDETMASRKRCAANCEHDAVQSSLCGGHLAEQERDANLYDLLLERGCRLCGLEMGTDEGAVQDMVHTVCLGPVKRKAALWDEHTAKLIKSTNIGEPISLNTAISYLYEALGDAKDEHNETQEGLLMDALSVLETLDIEALVEKAAEWDEHQAREPEVIARVAELHGELNALRPKAALWDGHAWRAECWTVLSAIRAERPMMVASAAGTVAQSLVRGAGDNQLQLGLVVAIADHESTFNPYVKGKQGEVGLMQVLPMKGRKMSLYTDPLDGPSNALRDFLVPHIAEHGIMGALKRYNGSASYAKKVLALQAKKYSGGLWSLVPQRTVKE